MSEHRLAHREKWLYKNLVNEWYFDKNLTRHLQHLNQQQEAELIQLEENTTANTTIANTSILL